MTAMNGTRFIETVTVNFGIDELMNIAMLSDYSIARFLTDFVRTLRVYRNIHANFIVMEETMEERRKINGTWTGPLELIEKNITDSYMIPMLLEAEFLEVIDVAKLFIYSNALLLSKLHIPDEKVQDILDSFANTEYQAIVTFISSVVVFALISYLAQACLAPSLNEPQNVVGFLPNLKTFLSIIFDMCCPLPRHWTGKILVVLFSFQMFYLTTIFNMFLTTSLVVKEDSKNIKTLEDIFRSKNPRAIPFAMEYIVLKPVMENAVTGDFRRLQEMYEAAVDPREDLTDGLICGTKRLRNMILHRKLVVLQMEEVVLFCSSIFCSKNTAPTFFLSTQPFLQILFGFGFRKTLDPHVKKAMNEVLIPHLLAIFHYCKYCCIFAVDRSFVQMPSSDLSTVYPSLPGSWTKAFELNNKNMMVMNTEASRSS